MNLTDADREAWATPWWVKQTCPECGIEHAGLTATCRKCRGGR